MVDATQMDTKRAIDEMNRGAEEVEVGTRVVHEMGDSFNSIPKSIEQVTTEMLNVSKSTQIIAMNTVQLSEVLTEMEISTLENAEYSQSITVDTDRLITESNEIKTFAQKMNYLVSELKQGMSKYTIKH